MRTIYQEDGFRLVLIGKTYQIEYFSPEKGFTTRQTLGTSDLERARDLFRLKKARATRGPTREEELKETEITELYSRHYLKFWEKVNSKYVYKRGLQLVKEYLDGVLVQDFVGQRQDRFVEDLKSEGLDIATVSRIACSVGTAIKAAYQAESLTGWPYVKPVKIPVANNRPHILTDDEARTLIEAAKGNEHAWRYVQLAFQTGARPQAIIDLEKSQFLLDKKLIDLLPQGQVQNEKKRRPTLPLSQELLIACQGWEDGPIFRTGTGRRIKKLQSYRGIQDFLRPHFPKECSLYTLRRTLATEFMDKGVPGDQISIWLGHQPQGIAKVSLIYAQMRPEALGHALTVVQNYWGRLNDRKDDGRGNNAGVDSERLEERSGEPDVLDWVCPEA